MRINLEVPGFEGRSLYVEVSTFGTPKVFLDDAPLKPQKGGFVLTKNDGSSATAKFGGFFLDPATSLEIDGISYELMEPLKWYQWVWSGVPVILIFTGGFIGGAIGGLAVWFNTRFFRMAVPVPVRYLLSALVSCTAIVGFFFFAGLVHLALDKNQSVAPKPALPPKVVTTAIPQVKEIVKVEVAPKPEPPIQPQPEQPVPPLEQEKAEDQKKIDLDSVEYLTETLKTSSDQSVIKKSMGKLILNKDRAERLAVIVQNFPRISSVNNRAWILLEMDDFARFRSDANFKTQYDTLADLGINDPEPAVRAAAVRAKAACFNLLDPASSEASNVIPPGASDSLRAELALEFQRTLAERYASANLRGGLDRKNQELIVQKLVEMAGSPDEATVLAALGGFKNLYDVAIVTSLLQLFPTTSEACRVKIFEVCGVNNDQAFEVFLPFYEKGLAALSPSVRASAFAHLSKWSASKERKAKVFAMVQTASQNETDADLKKKMDDWVKRAQK